MICLRKIGVLLLLIVANNAFGQLQKPPKINDVFMTYLEAELQLSPSESSSMRPLVKKYLQQRRQIAANFSDPLERQQKTVDLKINYREQFSNIIGYGRANQFFIKEQVFRRKVNEVLKNRREQKKNN